MIVYIAGPITGRDGYKERFAAAQTYLISKGFLCLNPTVLPQNLPYEKYFPVCYGMIDASDAIYMLQGWEQSPGSRKEYLYAHVMDKKILFEE